MNGPVSPLDDLTRLAASGRLRLVYVLGIPRSNTTVVCRLLGERLDGAVFEPAMPNSASPARHYASLIRTAYDAARAAAGDDRPVVLAVKDLDGFVTPGIFDFILSASDHIVFTTRDPASQYASLERQFAEEFSVWQRTKASILHPVEQFWFLIHLFGWLPRFLRISRDELGPGLNPLRAAAAGFGYASWRVQAEHLGRARAALGADAVTVFDAGLMRLFPDQTDSALTAIADAVAAAPATAGGAEFAGHTRMAMGSHWAREARAGGNIKPLAAHRPQRLSPAGAAFAANVATSLLPRYLELFFDPAHRQRLDIAALGLEDSAPPLLRSLMAAPDAAAARQLADRHD